MTSAPHLLNEDRSDFEHVLDDALRIVLDDMDAESGSPLNAEQLRTMALAASDLIGAAAADEYDTYRTLRADLRESARESARAREHRTFGYAAMGVAEGAGSGAGLFAVMAVLTPILAGAAAVIFLLIGYALAAVSPEPAIASPLRTAGWFFAAVMGASVLLGAVGLVLTALRDSSSAIHDTPEAMPPEVAQARRQWQEALLTLGLLPFLDDALADAAANAATAATATTAATTATAPPAAAPQPRIPRLGYSRPDFSSPQDFTSPDYSGPDFGSPGFTGPDRRPE
ncbi:hypothetical protein [Actinacidiphila rubida]|uniref:Transmembrane protein n=1 Tax=Actinacidiphila rubida TaxID=310780 RepID=A0A1H8GEJ9_9ACTN|nr:hypothetical protein [Actinacidiphila rubida]SEN42239.1 hypothetical protein SAMN05216267_100547 [Actinacidiphila rubida]